MFATDPVTCARGLIGSTLRATDCAGVIVETEAYSTQGDAASHTAMYAPARRFLEAAAPGDAYVFHHLGIHWLLNATVKGPVPGFVLVRALRPTEGLDAMAWRCGLGAPDAARLCAGPARLTRALGIDGRLHGTSLLLGRGPLQIDWAAAPSGSVATPRVGITRSADLPWRFVASR